MASKPDYLFDIVAMSAAFRDAFCDELERLAAQGKLERVDAAGVRAAVAEMRAKAWEVFAKPFDGPEPVLGYLEPLRARGGHLELSEIVKTSTYPGD